MSETPAIVQRARTEEQKELRRQTILDAADDLLSEVGFEAFAMAALGRRAGVVKGTLYLYFETREEVLLTLYCQKLAAWCARLDAAIGGGCDDEAFAGAVYDTAYLDSAFLNLTSRLDSVIEHNVSLESLITAKRAMADELTQLAEAVAPRLQLSATQAIEAIGALAALLLGAYQVDTGPRIDDQALPDDVRQFMSAFASRQLFSTNAVRILTGIRAGH